MNSEEFFKNNKIDSIEKAKKAYKYCGCNKYHMWHDYTDKLKEYEMLNISRSMELEWMGEQFIEEVENVNQLYAKSEEWWYTYSRLIEKLSSLKKRNFFEIAINLSENIIGDNLNINHFHMLSSIIGNNSTKTHGGLIEAAVNSNHKDIANTSYSLARFLEQEIERILHEERLKHLIWLRGNLNDIIEVWPSLCKDKTETFISRVLKMIFKKV